MAMAMCRPLDQRSLRFHFAVDSWRVGLVNYQYRINLALRRRCLGTANICFSEQLLGIFSETGSVKCVFALKRWAASWLRACSCSQVVSEHLLLWEQLLGIFYFQRRGSLVCVRLSKTLGRSLHVHRHCCLRSRPHMQWAHTMAGGIRATCWLISITSKGSAQLDGSSTRHPPRSVKLRTAPRRGRH
jgi:hypothetical protein